MILVALAKRLRTKSAQYRFLSAHADALVARLGLPRFPARSTYFQRYRTASVLMVAAAAAHTDHAAARGHIHVRCVAADKTLIAAAGPPWHQAQRRRGERPRGADAEASWSRSAHDGWVYGYGLEAVVTAPPARGDLAADRLGRSCEPSEAKTFPDKPPRLPAGVRYVLVDMGYDSNDLGEALEYDGRGRRTGRRLVGPHQVRHNRYGPPKKAWRETRGRRLRREYRRGAVAVLLEPVRSLPVHAAGPVGRAVLRPVQGVVRPGGACLAHRAGQQSDTIAGGAGCSTNCCWSTTVSKAKGTRRISGYLISCELSDGSDNPYVTGGRSSPWEGRCHEDGRRGPMGPRRMCPGPGQPGASGSTPPAGIAQGQRRRCPGLSQRRRSAAKATHPALWGDAHGARSATRKTRKSPVRGASGPFRGFCGSLTPSHFRRATAPRRTKYSALAVPLSQVTWDTGGRSKCGRSVWLLHVEPVQGEIASPMPLGFDAGLDVDVHDPGGTAAVGRRPARQARAVRVARLHKVGEVPLHHPRDLVVFRRPGVDLVGGEVAQGVLDLGRMHRTAGGRRPVGLRLRPLRTPPARPGTASPISGRIAGRGRA